MHTWEWVAGFPDGSEVKNLLAILGSGRSPGGGHGNPLQYSCLENPMDMEGRAWQDTVYGVVQSKESDMAEHTQEWMARVVMCVGGMCGRGKHTCGSGCGWREDHPGALWPGYNMPPCKAVTDLGAHFSSYQVPHSPQEAALLGQDLRFLSLRPLETHSSGEHRTQTQEIKSHLAPERGQKPLGRNWRFKVP